MRFAIQLTAAPGSTMSDYDKPVPFGDDEPRYFQGFRTRTGRGVASMYGGIPEVLIFHSHRHAKVKTWATREAAEVNVARLAERNYTGHVIPAEEVKA